MLKAYILEQDALLSWRNRLVQPLTLHGAIRGGGILRAALIGLTVYSREALAEQPDAGQQPPGAASSGLSLGIAAFMGSSFPGSRYDYISIHALPTVLYQPFFPGGLPSAGTPAGLGINILQHEHWRFGVGLGTAIADIPECTVKSGLENCRVSVGAEYSMPAIAYWARAAPAGDTTKMWQTALSLRVITSGRLVFSPPISFSSSAGYNDAYRWPHYGFPGLFGSNGGWCSFVYRSRWLRNEGISLCASAVSSRF